MRFFLIFYLVDIWFNFIIVIYVNNQKLHLMQGFVSSHVTLVVVAGIVLFLFLIRWIFNKPLMFYLISSSKNTTQRYCYLWLAFFKKRRRIPGEIVWSNRKKTKKLKFLSYNTAYPPHYRFRLIEGGSSRDILVEGNTVTFKGKQQSTGI